METTSEAIPDLALDDIIKNKKQERRNERRAEFHRGGFRGQNRGRPFRGRGNFQRRDTRERSREYERDRRRYSDEYSDYSRSPSQQEEDRNRPKKRIVIKRTGEGQLDPHPHQAPVNEAPKRTLPSTIEGFNPDHTIQIRNFPTEINMKDMITLFKDFGTLRNLSVNWTKKKDSQCTVYVEFSSHKEAARAKDKYNNADMEGFTLKITFLETHS